MARKRKATGSSPDDSSSQKSDGVIKRRGRPRKSDVVSDSDSSIDSPKKSSSSRSKSKSKSKSKSNPKVSSKVKASSKLTRKTKVGGKGGTKEESTSSDEPEVTPKRRGRPKGSTGGKKGGKKKGKRRGRKPSSPNRYNAVRKAISDYYLSAVGRRIRRYELKVIYDWIKANYGNQSIRYLLMNIDVVLDGFWTEYCNTFPVEIGNFARFFDWYMFKNILADEAEFHYPNDIIEVDFSDVGVEPLSFLMEDYASKAEEYYEICKTSGIKQSSPPPFIFLESAYCDVQRKGNVFKYKILLDGQVPTETPQEAPQATQQAQQDIPQATTEIPTQIAPKTAPQPPQQAASTEQVQSEIEKERIRKEYELKNRKLDELSQLLRDKVITFEEYLKAVKEL